MNTFTLQRSITVAPAYAFFVDPPRSKNNFEARRNSFHGYFYFYYKHGRQLFSHSHSQELNNNYYCRIRSMIAGLTWKNTRAAHKSELNWHNNCVFSTFCFGTTWRERHNSVVLLSVGTTQFFMTREEIIVLVGFIASHVDKMKIFERTFRIDNKNLKQVFIFFKLKSENYPGKNSGVYFNIFHCFGLRLLYFSWISTRLIFEGKLFDARVWSTYAFLVHQTIV